MTTAAAPTAAAQGGVELDASDGPSALLPNALTGVEGDDAVFAHSLLPLRASPLPADSGDAAAATAGMMVMDSDSATDAVAAQAALGIAVKEEGEGDDDAAPAAALGLGGDVDEAMIET